MIYIAKPLLGAEEKESISKVVDSGMIACGAVVSEFEQAFSSYCGASYGIATTSGTTALEVAIKSLELSKDAKVLTTPFSFIASTNSIVYAGLTPVFADINEKTFNLDYEKMEEVLKKDDKIEAVLIVHLFGYPCDMDKIQDLVEKYDVKLIEDCAQAHGAEFNGKKVGSFGDVAAFSFYPTKNMTTGEGGMMLTSNEKYQKKAKMLINHGMDVRYYHDIIGYNYRMTNIAASIGLCQLEKLDMMNQNRKKNAKYYIDNIKNPLVTTPEYIEGHVYHQFTVKVANDLRDSFTEYLQNNGIGFGVFYPLSIPEQKCYDEFNFEKSYAVTDKIKGQVVSLPIHQQLTGEELEEVVKVINNFEI